MSRINKKGEYAMSIWMEAMDDDLTILAEDDDLIMSSNSETDFIGEVTMSECTDETNTDDINSMQEDVDIIGDNIADVESEDFTLSAINNEDIINNDDAAIDINQSEISFAGSIHSQVMTELGDLFPSPQAWNEKQMDLMDDMPDFDRLNITEWNQMQGDTSEQLKVLQNLSNQCAEIQGMVPVPIKFGDPGDGCAGGYSPEDRTITLREKDLAECDTPQELRELRDTVLHETFHGYQHQCIENPSLHDNPLEVAIWRENMKADNYISMEEDLLGYYNQPLERSAYEFARTQNQQIEYALTANDMPGFWDKLKEGTADFIADNRELWKPLAISAAKAIKTVV